VLERIEPTLRRYLVPIERELYGTSAGELLDTRADVPSDARTYRPPGLAVTEQEFDVRPTTIGPTANPDRGRPERSRPERERPPVPRVPPRRARARGLAAVWRCGLARTGWSARSRTSAC
jgi:hypothetical protein